MPTLSDSLHDAPVMRWIAIGMLAGMLFPSAVTVTQAFGSRHIRGELLEFGLFDSYKRRGAAYWFRLDAVSDLPDDTVISTTEVGLPAAMNPREIIVDLTGINKTRLAHQGFSADYLFVFLPSTLPTSFTCLIRITPA
jgi:hypothetical protein